MRSAEVVSRRPGPNLSATASRGCPPRVARSSRCPGIGAGARRGAGGGRRPVPSGRRAGSTPMGGRSGLGRSLRGGGGAALPLSRAPGTRSAPVGVDAPAAGRGTDEGRGVVPAGAGRGAAGRCGAGAGRGSPAAAAGRDSRGGAAAAVSGPGAVGGLRLSTTVRRDFLTTTIRRRSVSGRAPAVRPLSGRSRSCCAAGSTALGGSGLRFMRVALGLRFSSESCGAGGRSGVALGLSSLILSQSYPVPASFVDNIADTQPEAKYPGSRRGLSIDRRGARGASFRTLLPPPPRRFLR